MIAAEIWGFSMNLILSQENVSGTLKYGKPENRLKTYMSKDRMKYIEALAERREVRTSRRQTENMRIERVTRYVSLL